MKAATQKQYKIKNWNKIRGIKDNKIIDKDKNKNLEIYITN